MSWKLKLSVLLILYKTSKKAIQNHWYNWNGMMQESVSGRLMALYWSTCTSL